MRSREDPAETARWEAAKACTHEEGCPHYEWAETTQLGDIEPRYMRTRCRHVDLVPVRNILTEELVAQLCWTCGTQLPPTWPQHPDYPPGFEPDPDLIADKRLARKVRRDMERWETT